MKQLLLFFSVFFITFSVKAQDENRVKANVFTYNTYLSKKTNNQDLKIKLDSQEVFFITHGISANQSNLQLAFTQKYGIQFIADSCMVDPLTFNKTSENNKRIATYLDEIYGLHWRKEMPCKLLGVALK